MGKEEKDQPRRSITLSINLDRLENFYYTDHYGCLLPPENSSCFLCGREVPYSPIPHSVRVGDDLLLRAELPGSRCACGGEHEEDTCAPFYFALFLGLSAKVIRERILDVPEEKVCVLEKWVKHYGFPQELVDRAYYGVTEVIDEDSQELPDPHGE